MIIISSQIFLSRRVKVTESRRVFSVFVGGRRAGLITARPRFARYDDSDRATKIQRYTQARFARTKKAKQRSNQKKLVACLVI